jgi:hypothetical protein
MMLWRGDAGTPPRVTGCGSVATSLTTTAGEESMQRKPGHMANGLTINRDGTPR